MFIALLQLCFVSLSITTELTLMKKKEVKRDLKEKEAALSQQKVLLKQMQDLLYELERLDIESRRYWILTRYSLLVGGVENMLFAFRQIPSRTLSRTL